MAESGCVQGRNGSMDLISGQYMVSCCCCSEHQGCYIPRKQGDAITQTLPSLMPIGRCLTTRQVRFSMGILRLCAGAQGGMLSLEWRLFLPYYLHHRLQSQASTKEARKISERGRRSAAHVHSYHLNVDIQEEMDCPARYFLFPFFLEFLLCRISNVIVFCCCA
jgi:hypothetical protein